MTTTGHVYQKYKLYALDVLYLQQGLTKCIAQEKRLAETFYKSLFETYPHTEALFGNDEAKQQAMFSTLIAAAAAEMMNPKTLEPLLRSVGNHHRNHKITRAHLEMGRIPFFTAVMTCIGNDDFAEHDAAWNHLYSMLIDAMMGETIQDFAG